MEITQKEENQEKWPNYEKNDLMQNLKIYGTKDKQLSLFFTSRRKQIVESDKQRVNK